MPGDAEQFGVDGGRSGEDVARQDVVGAGPVGDDAAGLPDQERPGGDVPRAERQLEEPVEHTGRHPRQVERGGAGPAEVLEALERRIQARGSSAGSTSLCRNGKPVPTTARSAERSATRSRSTVPPARSTVAPSPRLPRRSREGTEPPRRPRWASRPPRARPTPRRRGSRGGSSWCRPAGRPASSDRDVAPPRSSPTRGMPGVASRQESGDRAFARAVDRGHVVACALLHALVCASGRHDRLATHAGRPGGDRQQLSPRGHTRTLPSREARPDGRVPRP